MNWLAHIYLSEEDKESKLGGLLGDFLTNTDWNSIYSEGIKKGIKRHLAIDKFTDMHPVFQNSCERISKNTRHFAPVLIDIFYDHYLAKNWDKYADDSLDAFTSSFYTVLEEYKEKLPDRLSNAILFMIRENWLSSYQKIEGIQEVLFRLSRKVNMQNTIAESITELITHYEDLENDFCAFFPEIIQKFCPEKLSQIKYPGLLIPGIA